MNTESASRMQWVWWILLIGSFLGFLGKCSGSLASAQRHRHDCFHYRRAFTWNEIWSGVCSTHTSGRWAAWALIDISLFPNKYHLQSDIGFLWNQSGHECFCHQSKRTMSSPGVINFFLKSNCVCVCVCLRVSMCDTKSKVKESD